MKGVCVSGHPEVSAAGARMLGAGGNAFDAAVAAGFVSSLCEPALTSLGGGGFLLAHGPDGQVLYDFFVDTPGAGLDQTRWETSAEQRAAFEPVRIQFKGAVQDFNIGYASAAVPGTVAGLLHVHDRRGRLPLAEVVAPAVELAKDGVVVTAMQAYTFELLYPILTATPEGMTMFAAAPGVPLPEGAVMKNPDLARFLEGLPGSAEALYRGEVGRGLVAEMKDAGGLVTGLDLERYRVIERAPYRRRYRDHEVFSNPAPALGGSMIGLMLWLLEQAGPQGPAFQSPAHIVQLARVMKTASDLRHRGRTEPEKLAEGERAEVLEQLQARRKSTRGTTHLTVIDTEGQVASLTTSNGEGSGHFIPGTGIMINNMLGEEDLHPGGFHEDPPGERVASMMAPTLVLDGAGDLKLALGSGGSKRIRTAITQVLSHVVDFGQPVQDAVSAPRVHFEDGRIHLEGGFDDAVYQALVDEGLDVNRWPVRDLFFGGVHAAGPSGFGADDRRGGVAVRAD